MKFSCDRCQTRYSIGDDKVRGKVLKIRCKTCGNIVVVRELLPTVQGEASGYAVPQMVSAGAGAGSLSTPGGVTTSSAGAPSPLRADAVEWFIAIKGKQHGPASAEEVARLFREGRITERSYLWHEKLTTWKRLKELPEFAGVLAEGPAPVRHAPAPPPPPEDGAEIVNFEAARAQRQQQNQQNQPAAVMSDPFAAVAPGPGGHQEAPRDSTRVFIMQAGLHNRGTRHKLYAGMAVAGAVALVALIVIDYQLDILGLRQVVDAVAEKTGIKDAPPEDPGAGWDDVDADPTLKCRLMPDPAACIKEAKARAKVGGGRKKPANTGGAAVSDDDLKGAFGTGAAGGADTGTGAVAAVGGDGFVSVGAGTPSKEDIDRMLKGGKGGPTGPKVRIELPATIGSGIDAENAKKVVQDGQGGIQLCVDSAMRMGEEIPGKVIFTLSIGQKGHVERAVASNAVVGANSLGSCLTGTMKKWKFTPPTEPTDLDIPLILR